MKNYIYLILTFCLISCSESGDKYEGNYANKNKYTIIKKAGDDGYFLTFSEKYEGEYTYYCVYKKGCFIKINKNGEFPIMCINGNQLIDNNGITFKKVKKINRRIQVLYETSF